MRFATNQYVVSVDPPPIDKIDIVIQHKLINGCEQLKVADIRHEIGLHDGYSHSYDRAI